MKKTLKTLINNERGAALLAVLALFTLGSLTMVPMLAHAATTVKNGKTIQNNIKGMYAAEAGVENVIWAIEHSQIIPTALVESPNQMTVSMSTESFGTYTLVFGEMIPITEHFDYLSIDDSMVWDAGANAYKYIVTVTRHGTPSTIWLTGVGARLPVGYTYQAGSANSFPANLSRAEPEIVYDAQNGQMLNWAFPKVALGDSQTETFYFTGSGDLNGEYCWVVANREDIGEVGSLTGGIYKITSTATNPANNKVTAKIISNVMIIDGAAEVISWQVTK